MLLLLLLTHIITAAKRSPHNQQRRRQQTKERERDLRRSGVPRMEGGWKCYFCVRVDVVIWNNGTHHTTPPRQYIIVLFSLVLMARICNTYVDGWRVYVCKLSERMRDTDELRSQHTRASNRAYLHAFMAIHAVTSNASIVCCATAYFVIKLLYQWSQFK